MTTPTKIRAAIAAAIVILICILGKTAWDAHRIRKLELAVEAAKVHAAAIQANAAEKEREADIYREKLSYLDQQLSEIQKTARKQDEQLEKQNNNTRVAGDRVDRARRTRSIDSTELELCEKLASLGHGCKD